MLCAEFAADGEVEFAGADDGAVAGGWSCVRVDRYDGYRVGGGDGGAVVFGRVMGDREAGAGTDDCVGGLEVACA